MPKNGNSSLERAKKQKNDEFYTRLGDVERGGKSLRLCDCIVIRRRK